LFKLPAAETTGQGVFKVISADWVLVFFGKHVLTDKIARLPDIKF
jgi:hypothetical protein